MSLEGRTRSWGRCAWTGLLGMTKWGIYILNLYCASRSTELIIGFIPISAEEHFNVKIELKLNE